MLSTIGLETRVGATSWTRPCGLVLAASQEARNIADRLSQVKVYTEADARMPVKAGLTWADVFVTERDIILAR